ncbi:MAG: hypothetical protein LBH07_04875 [Treponema sp.]|jgi:PTS system galactitol-specific IIC component|nr:hypothetical protein [Treponema sp.]
MEVLELIASGFSKISGLGSMVMVPLMFSIISLVFGLGIAKAFKVGLTIGIGFLALNLAIGLIWQFITPAADILLQKFGLDLKYVDGGWMTGAAIGFASPIGTFIIPFALLVNIVLLATNQTKTLNVDIWNFWHYCFYGAIAYLLTGSLIWGYIMAGVMAAISLKFGDMGAKYIEKEMGIPGISVPQCFAASTIPLGLALEKLYDKIPGLNKIEVDSETLSRKLGVFGEPATIGFILGLIISLAAGYSVKGIIETSIGVGALMLLMPRMVKILMEGLIPLSEAAKAFMQKRFKGRDFYIGLDSAITLANPTPIVVGILIIPITLMIALLPFNQTLPAGDLSAGAYYVCFFSIIHKNNFLRTLISGTILMLAVYWFMSIFAPTINQMAIAASYVQEGSAMGISAGMNVVAGFFLLFVKWIGGNIGGVVMLAVAVGVYMICSIYYKKNESKAI